jgi:sugar O-acyltransferase (sialic acid O-acetyltransferase NeuD family)
MTYIHRKLEKKLCIIGAGDMAQSLYFSLKQGEYKPEIAAFLESDDIFEPRNLHGLPVRSLSSFDPESHQALIALGNPQARYQITRILPAHTEYGRFIHPQNQILLPESFELGEGSVIFPYCTVSREASIGKHALVLGQCIIAHHIRFGDFFTAGAKFNSGGHCQIGDRVFSGMSVCIRDRVHVGDDITLGMGSVVLKSLVKPGVYWGNPAVWQKD